MGLAALAAMKEPGLKPLDSTLCVSASQRTKITQLRAEAIVPSKSYWKHGYKFALREDDASFANKLASSEEPPRALAGGLNALNLHQEVKS